MTRLSSGRSRKAKRLALFALFSAVIIQGLSAQQQDFILFHGVVLDASTRQPLEGAHFTVGGRAEGAADNQGMFSLYARQRDTLRFTCVGYRDYVMTVSDTLRAREYAAGIYMTADTLMIAAVVILPRLGNIRAEIMSDRPVADQQMVNASNNLKISAYQGLTSASQMGDPATNYEVLRQKQRADAYEKGMIPSDKLVIFNPLILIPVVYVLAKGLPEAPEPPKPYISPREMQQINIIHDSLIYKRK